MLLLTLRRSVLPKECHPLRFLRYSQVVLDTTNEHVSLDGYATSALVGNWMFYMPELELKLFHPHLGFPDCIHPSKPSHWRGDIDEQLDHFKSPYTLSEWRQALNTPLSRRLAELWLVSSRLWRAGLGPQPLGICAVDNFFRDGKSLGKTCGLISQNVNRLVRKRPCTLAMVRASGVVPDRIHSCVRQQVRGWVVDLCSVVGCMPMDADFAVSALCEALQTLEDDQSPKAILDRLSESLIG